jgi:hypothetical protein
VLGNSRPTTRAQGTQARGLACALGIHNININLVLVRKAKGYLHNLKQESRESEGKSIILKRNCLSLTFGMYRENSYKTIQVNYLIFPLRNNKGVLSSRSGISIFRRLPSLSTFWNSLGHMGWGMIVKISNPCSIRHLFPTEASQPPNGLVCARDIFNIHQVEVHLSSRIPPPSPKHLEFEIDPICLGGVSNPRGKGQLVKVISSLCLGLLQLEPHLLVKAMEVLILLFSHNLAYHHSIH